MKKILERMRMERLYQEDYTRTMEREYQRLERERAIQVQADKERAVSEMQEFNEYMLAYERDSAKFGF
jgi:hypothetical protein